MAMIDAQLRAKIRDLMTLGDLPNERPRVHQVGYVPPEIPPRSAVCLICGEPGPQCHLRLERRQGGESARRPRCALEAGTRIAARAAGSEMGAIPISSRVT